MPGKKKLLSEMERVVTDLVVVAKDLHECSKGALAEEELNALQERQDTLVNELVELDAAITDEGGVAKQGAVWKRIRLALDEFQHFNQKFISNVNVRKGLVQFDLANVRKSRKFLADMRGSYGKTDAKDKRSPRLDKLQ